MRRTPPTLHTIMSMTICTSIVLSGCVAPPVHRSTPPTSVAVNEARVLSVVPTNEFSVRREFAPGGGTVLWPICAICAFIAIENAKAAQRQQDERLLPELQSKLGERYMRTQWDETLRGTLKRASRITASEVIVVGNKERPTAQPEKSASTTPLILLELDHYLSYNLDKLRMRVRARVFDDKGKVLADSHYFFLPPAIPGATKSEAVAAWTANGAAAYRELSNRGITAILDALDLTLFSAAPAQQQPSDASDLLARTSCYAGDFEVGIPLKDYQSGVLLATRPEYWIVRLANNDVLVIPSCNR